MNPIFPYELPRHTQPSSEVLSAIVRIGCLGQSLRLGRDCLGVSTGATIVYLDIKKKVLAIKLRPFAVRTRLELVSVTLCITTIFITLFLLCSQFVASIEYFEST